MQIKIFLSALFFPILLVSLIFSPGYCGSADKAYEQLKLELESEGVSGEFIQATGNSVKRMIASGGPTADIKKVLLDLWSEKVTGRALKNAVAAVAELVASGDNVLEAGKIASGAAHKAEAEGLSGFGVGMRVKKAVQERKAYLKSLKK
ncbi:MAG: hypothetical protein PHP10_01000 [Candidatus Omnitrophica bacterium]|nr:hypothetical protein [Candidatus Omnitrophota bacterium]